MTRTADPPRALPRVYLSTALWMTAYSLIVVTLPFRFEDLGLSVLQYSIVLAASSFGMLATESLWGAVAFRIGRRPLILALGGSLTLVFVAVGFARSFVELVAILILLGVLFIFPIPLSRWLSLTAWGPGTGGAGTGRYGLFFGLGLVIGSSVGPLAYVRFGFVPLTMAAGVVSLAAAINFAAIPWETAALPSRGPDARSHVRDVLRQRFLLCAGLVTIYFVAYCLTVDFLQYYSMTLFGGTASDAGYVIGMARGVTLAAGFLLGPVVDRWSPERSSPLGFVLLAVGALGTLVATDYTGMIVATLVFSTGTGLLSASLLPLALGAVPRPAQGTAVGVFGSFEDLGLLVGPVVIGGAYSAYGAPSIFPVVAGIAAAGALFAAAIPRWTRARSR